MHQTDGHLRFSPSDLAQFMDSRFVSWMTRYDLEHPGELTRDEPDPMLDLLRRRGREHEAAVLETLRAEGRNVVEIGDDGRSVTVDFAAADVTRRYAVRSAPLRRVRFAPGDRIVGDDGSALSVDSVSERDGLFVYHCQGREVAETRVAPDVALGGARERLSAGRVDPPTEFALRVETARRLHAIRRSEVRGLCGARIELLPHQYYVAAEAAARRAPRVLLADETGLGKTIEACLTVNRLLLTGRAERVLILVPGSLIH